MSLGQAVLELVTDAKGLETGLAAAKSKTESWGASVGGVGKAGALAIAAVGTAALGILGGLTVMANATARTAGEVAKLKRETGLSAEQASKLSVIGKRLGLDTEELSKSFGKFSKLLVDSREKLGEYDIKVVESSKGHVDFDKTLANVADRFRGMPDGVEKSALAMDLFGKTGKDLIPFLNKGSAGLKELGEEAARMGLVFDDKALASAKRYRDAQKDLGENIDGLKNKIGMAFLPVLAEMSEGMLKLATAVLPSISAGFDKVSGFVRTAIGVFKDMQAAAGSQMKGGGDFLGSIIGPEAAATFMQTVTNVSLTLNHFWEKVILPALTYVKENAPVAWRKFQEAVQLMWTIAEPILKAVEGKLGALKDKFDALPGPVKRWAEQTTAAALVVHVTGIDDMIMGWASAMGNFASGGAAAWAIFAKAGIAAALTTAAAFGILLAAVGAVIFIGTHLDELEQSWIMLSQLYKLEFAKVGDFVIGVFAKILGNIQGTVNSAIDIINPLWTLLGNPPIPHIVIELPNAHLVEAALADIARTRYAQLSVSETFNRSNQERAEYALAGGGIVTRPTRALIGEDGPEAVIPLNRAGDLGGLTGGDIVIHQTIVMPDGEVLSKQVQRYDRGDQRRRGLVAEPFGI